ncbi:hypothetical protein EH31_08920 [Erythrobacter longus]|uniref:Chemotaxis protein n=1 Tax=Erythrobacter longus TaxID=1044 RepID=A0A074M652_ERYLO|nr:methyl-accepting chemotaxis protein [Erythrobacter longus]KEO90201.1 hypothetical protein EH31_08920 [Erythrobacter longus]
MSALQEIAIDLEASRAADPKRADGGLQTGEGGVLEWLKGLSIGRKITLFFSVNLALALLGGVVFIFAFVELNKQTQQTTNSHRSAFLAERVVADLTEAEHQINNLVKAGDPTTGAVALSRLDSALVSLGELQSTTRNQTAQGQKIERQSDANSAQIAQLTTSVSKLREDLGDTIIRSRAIGASTLGISSAEMGSFDLDTAQALAKQLEADALQTASFNSSLMTSVLAFWIAIVIILLALTLMAQRFFDRHVSAALSGLANVMTRLSSGEQIEKFEHGNRADEIGQMTRAVMVFQRAAIRLERLSLERSQKAREQLEEQARVQQEREAARTEREQTLRKIADSFERKIGDVVGEVAAASSQLQTTATSMAARAQQTSTRTSEVSSAMQDANFGATAAASASDEFAVSIGEVSRQAESSAQLARKASASTQEADETIAKLAASAQQVGQIVELIQTIAQRTNLLALNASIEAARGGEAGRGFAVVASEVKELAMQTSRATEKVAKQIREMQETTGASVAALRSIAIEVEGLERVAVEMAGAVNQQSYAGQDLARSIDMAARGTAEVSEHIKEVQELSASTGNAASQVLSSATALQQQAATLRSQVNGFLDEVRAP